MKSKLLIIALALPIVFFAGMTIFNEYVSRNYSVHIFPIEAYDPRDYLSGNYLRFQIIYPFEIKCPHTQNSRSTEYLCLKPEQKLISQEELNSCAEWIKGNCLNGNFTTDINRFYVPESKASKLETALFQKKGSIVLSVGPGQVIIKDLLIDGKSWKDY